MSRIWIHQERCKGCGLCANACPKKILEMSDKLNNKGYAPVRQLKPALCSGCAFCAILCPDSVITVEKGE